MLEELKKQVYEANLKLVEFNLVLLTWGNVSGIDREKGLVVIKPSGIEYDNLKIEDMVVVNLSGQIVEGSKNPSSDTPTHLELYKAFPEIGGVTHTHSKCATMFAQACMQIPCLGTTHADHFDGAVPLTRFLNEEEASSEYEKNTGKIIIECFKDLDYKSTPAVLVAGHAPFCFGKNAFDSVRNSLILERIAEMAIGTYHLNNDAKDLPKYISDKHYQRKHGSNAYYGQKNK